MRCVVCDAWHVVYLVCISVPEIVFARKKDRERQRDRELGVVLWFSLVI